MVEADENPKVYILVFRDRRQEEKILGSAEDIDRV
jgi:hypothetical protein